MASKFNKEAAIKGFLSGTAPQEEAPALEHTNRKEEPETEQPTTEETGAKVRGRKPLDTKKIQTTIYFTEEQLIKLDEQTGLGKKERDKSALVRFAVDIILGMSQEQYKALKQLSTLQEKEAGEIISEALHKFSETGH